MKESVIPKKLLDELEDVAKVYNSKSGMVVYPDSLSKLRTEIMKVCNEKQIAEKHILELIADKGRLTDRVKELETQIEKMKCCANCKHQCSFLFQDEIDCAKNGLPKWEVK